MSLDVEKSFEFFFGISGLPQFWYKEKNYSFLLFHYSSTIGGFPIEYFVEQKELVLTAK